MKELEMYYQLFADHIVDAVPEVWNKAWIYVEMDEDYRRYAGRYQETEDESSLKSFLLDPSLKEKIVEFWELFRSTNNEPWFAFTFALLPDGRFELNYDYEKPY